MSARFGCPKGHTEKIQESFRCWVWFPVHPESGDPDTQFGNEEFDEESFESNHVYYCSACDDTFPELIEIEIPEREEKNEGHKRS